MAQPGGIAIIGIACRLAGALDWRQFWTNLCDGKESLTRFSDTELLAEGVPPEQIRDPQYVKAGYVLDGYDGFDAGFFGYSPFEARLIDPQQRHLLEVAWQAFEDSGYPPGRGHGPVAVYATTGTVVTNYMMNALSDHPDSHYGGTASLLHFGNDKDYASTRISFKLDLSGPSLNVQAACSTSLVMVDLAAKAIRDGDCSMALAAAATVRVPHRAGYLAVKGSIFSPDGRIRTFDANAGGTAFSSGVVAVLMKDLGRAIADGDNIYAVVRGSAVNNDGGRKTSYTVTSVEAQSEVMVKALAQASFAPSTIGYVECHGTGTSVGDPKELSALKRAFPGTGVGTCPIGSAKPNVGHAENASGLVSLVKTALMLKDGVVPPNINFDVPNPLLKLETSPFFVNTAKLPWRLEKQPRRALINALGMGGTNAALALEEAPVVAPRPKRPLRPLHLFLLSARTAPALDALVARYRTLVEGDSPPDLGDMCHTLAAGRVHFAHRLALAVESVADLQARLAAYRSETAGRVRDTPRRIAFLYSGQGSQFAGMGQALCEAEPAFREALDRVAAAMAPHLGRSILDILFEGGDAIHRTENTQPALFAVQVALADCLGAWGIRPMAVAGHSIGEFAAAHLAGVLTLDAAARLVCERGRLMGALSEGGAMAAVFADEATVRAVLEGLPAGTVDLAAVNGPQNTVISGQADSVESVLTTLEGRGIAARRLTVSHAFHSALMAPALDGLAQAAALADPCPATIPWVSTLTGQSMNTSPAGEYWCRQAREAVRFADAATTLGGMGITDYVEIGPGSGLLALARDCVPAGDNAWLPTLGKGGEEGRTLFGCVAGLHGRGSAVNWARFNAPFQPRRLSLPGYPFQHERLWHDAEAQPEGGRRPIRPVGGTLVGHRRPSPLAVQQFEAVYGGSQLPWLLDHRIHDAIVLPATAGLAAALGAARHSLGDADLEVVNFTQGEVLALADDEERPTCLLLEPDEGDQAHFTLTSQGREGAPWRTHMEGTVRRVCPDKAGRGANGFDAKRIQRRCGTSLKASAYYAGMKSLGLGYGAAFRGIESLWRGEGEALARVRLPDQIALSEGGDGPPPALLDACLHLYPAVIDALGDFSRPPPADAVMPLPVSMERFRMIPSTARDLWCHVRRRAPNGHAGQTVVDIEARDLDGKLVLGFDGVTLAPLARAQFRPVHSGRAEKWLYQLRWENGGEAPPSGSGPAHWLLLGGDEDRAAPVLAAALESQGATVRRVASDQMPQTPDSMADLLRSAAAEAGRGGIGVLYLGGLDTAGADPSDETAQRRGLGSAVVVARALATERGALAGRARLWLVTRNAAAVAGDDPAADILQAGLWGFGRSLAVEMPSLWGGLIDLEAGGDRLSEAPLVAAKLRRPDGETQFAFRQGRHMVARLVEAAPTERSEPLEAGGAYIVTGGLGAIGRKVAEWLARRRKAEILVLVGRQGRNAADAAAIIQAIEAIGAKVLVVKADMGNKADVRRLMKRVAELDVPLRGIYHGAGLVEDGMVEGMDWPQVRRVLAPKLDGAWWLHEFSAEAAPRDFVLFSSVLSLLGSAGQANYSAANACLDGLAAHRRRLGLPALVVNWGPWAESGMASGLDERSQAVWQARGLRFIDSDLGGQAFDQLFDGGLEQAVVVPMDWAAFLGQFAKVPALFTHFQDSGAAGLAADIVELRASLASDSPGRRRTALTRFLRQQVTSTLGLSEPIEPDRPLREVGLDSLMAVTLINRVEAAVGLRIPAFNLIRGPSIDQLIDDLWPDVAGAAAPTDETAPRDAAAPPPGAVEQGSWLITIVSPDKPKSRLFCFPFAGGGSATFRGWGAAMDPSVEVIAIEPPGRLTRIGEEPERDLGRWGDKLMEAMADKLDLPFAFFGHCLGSLTLYDMTCRLIDQAKVKPTHLFCSGARAPDRLKSIGTFEASLMRRLARMPGYRADLPPYRQPGPIFAEIVRHFDIAASEHLLVDPDLRRLMLPAVRADFEMASTYRFQRRRPLDVPITCFVAIGDIFVSREDILGWGRFTNRQLQVLMREGTHYSIIEDEAFIQRIISRELSRPVS